MRPSMKRVATTIVAGLLLGACASARGTARSRREGRRASGGLASAESAATVASVSDVVAVPTAWSPRQR